MVDNGKLSDVEKPGFEDEQVEHDDYEQRIQADPRINTFTPKEQRAIIWRVDKRLVLTLGFMYACAPE